eukprot:6285517-Prymnesium_polylepis.1
MLQQHNALALSARVLSFTPVPLKTNPFKQRDLASRSKAGGGSSDATAWAPLPQRKEAKVQAAAVASVAATGRIL